MLFLKKRLRKELLIKNSERFRVLGALAPRREPNPIIGYFKRFVLYLLIKGVMPSKLFSIK